MTLEAVRRETAPEFIDYCRQYGGENDDSYTGPDDLTLEAFNPGPEEPAFMLRQADGQVVGAASVMLKAYSSVLTSRLRIFHTLGHDPARYQILLDALCPSLGGLSSIHMYCPQRHQAVVQAVQQVGFQIRRYSICMERPAQDTPAPDFPSGLAVRPLNPQTELWAWAQVRNSAFVVLPDFRPLSVEELRDDFLRSPASFEGMLVLWDGDQPLGTVNVCPDKGWTGQPLVMIYTLAIDPAHQHLGLGRKLLRAAVEWGTARGIPRAGLVVNAENERAAHLYEQEGFERVETYLCLHYPLK
jgi:ribosomal protein S18 acetylase RimI-like enzyme